MFKKLLKSSAIALGATAAILMLYPLADESISIMRLLPVAMTCGASSVCCILGKWKIEDMEEEERRTQQLNNPVAPEVQIEINNNQANQEVQAALGNGPLPNVGLAYAVRVVNFLRGNER
jgi:hypothetical protein